MAWSAQEQANASAPAFDVRLRVYAGPVYSSLDLSTFTVGSLPPGWASADAPAAGWTEISARTSQAGRLTHERTGSALRWSAELSGWDYDAAYLGIKRAILVLRTLQVGATTSGPGLWFVGQVCSGGSTDDCRHGGQWTRTIRGTDSLLERANAPRLTAGPIDIANGASVTASSTLATPEAEAGNGEFLGSTANVDGANAVDGNLNTVWISSDVPTVTGETPAVSTVIIDKVFLNPLTGYDQTKLWWLEIFNSTAIDYQLCHENVGLRWYLVDNAGVRCKFETAGGNATLRAGERGIVCASRADFEAYTGGARSAAWIVEAKTAAPGFTLNPTAGSVRLHQGWNDDLIDSVLWNQTGASSPGVSGWTGAGINILTLPAGALLRRYPTGTDRSTAADWIFDANYEPGDYAEPGQTEWLLIAPAGQDAALAEDVALGATSIRLTSTLGLADAGDGVCEADAFAWTGRDGDRLTGVTGIGAHSRGARVYQTDGGVAQTGWPVRRVELRRRPGLSTPSRVRLYVQKTGESTPRTPPREQTWNGSAWVWDETWKADWDSGWELYVDVLSRGDEPPDDDSGTITWVLAGPQGQGYRWVRRILLYIEEMSDGGRAKINDVRILLAQAEVVTQDSLSGTVSSATSGSLARTLLVDKYGLTDGTFLDVTPLGNGQLGNHATAIAPYTTVLEDLARVTGCCVSYRTDGRVEWTPDPWWPVGSSDAMLTAYATLDDSYVRGTLRCQDALPVESAIVVHSRTPDGEQQFESLYPINAADAALRREYADYVCADSFTSWALAESLYCRDGLFLAEYTAGPGVVSLTLTGIGEWLAPDLWLRIYMLLADQQVSHVGVSGVETPGYIVERVTFEWAVNDLKQRTWKALADLRRFGR